MSVALHALTVRGTTNIESKTVHDVMYEKRLYI